jgi:putative phage-type endonuclease
MNKLTIQDNTIIQNMDDEFEQLFLNSNNNTSKQIINEQTKSKHETDHTILHKNNSNNNDNNDEFEQFFLNSGQYNKINNTTNVSQYKYPNEITYKKHNFKLEPIGTQWVHDIQKDDKITEIESNRSIQYDILRDIVLPEQRSIDWFKMRDSKITASDAGTTLGLNKYEPKYNVILKKTTIVPFEPNKNCYHGKKYEEIATKIYEYRMNVKVDEFGLIGHPEHTFIGASPDGICGKYKHNQTHLSSFVGRMLEIKCPVTRKIKLTGDILDICPIYYWCQVQLQLQCCGLDLCDFWQCRILEYPNKQDFINDTDNNEPFKSISTKLEKGCVIQLLPKNKINDVINNKYEEIVYDHATFLYPPKIDMTPYELDLWIAETMELLSSDNKYIDMYFDKIFYWKLDVYKNITIEKDDEWFAEKLPELKQMWEYILFFRKNKKSLSKLLEHIQLLKSNKLTDKKMNIQVMKMIDELYNAKKNKIK